MRVQILGSGCTTCLTLERKIRVMNDRYRLALEIEKVTDLQEIMRHGILSTPGLVVDGVVKSSGRVPGDEQLLIWLKGAEK